MPMARAGSQAVDLTLGAEERQVIDSAVQFLTRVLPVSRLHAAPMLMATDTRKQIAEMGWLAIGLPEALGGLGMSAIEEMLVFRELGRGLGPTLVLPAMLAAQLAAMADLPLAADFLGGDRGCALAVPVPGAAARVRLYDGQDASHAVIIGVGESVLFELAGVSRHRLPCLDKSVDMAEADLSQAAVLARIRGPEPHRRAVLAVAAMQAGIAEAVTAMIVDYAKIRTTFGKPIGAYQAVRHRCADMEVRCEAARAQLLYAAISLRDGLPDVELMLDAAHAVAQDAALENVDDNIQLHGGIGITEEHDAQLFMKRAQLLARWFGSERAILDRIARASLDQALAGATSATDHG